MFYNDDEVLREVDNEARRNQYLKDALVQASRSGDVENVERTLRQVLASLNRNVNDFFAFVHKAIEWFRNLF
jgi:uncharacterized membrane protein